MLEIEYSGTLYKRIGDMWVNAETYIKPPQRVINQLRRRVPESKKRTTKRSRSRRRRNKVQISAKLAPLIVDVIRNQHDSRQRYVRRGEIVGALMDHDKAEPLLRKAYEGTSKSRSFEWYVGNRVDWLSARITQGNAPVDERLERKRVDGKWAYRPAS